MALRRLAVLVRGAADDADGCKYAPVLEAAGWSVERITALDFVRVDSPVLEQALCVTVTVTASVCRPRRSTHASQ
jgi:hypothetical protein